MNNTSLDRRIRKLEAASGSEDIRHYLCRPLTEWPDDVLNRGMALTEEEWVALLADHPDPVCFRESRSRS